MGVGLGPPLISGVVMIVRYKGPKKQMTVMYPIGCKFKSQVKKYLVLAPSVELTDDEAEKLVALDPVNFELVGEATESKPKKRGKNG